MKQEHYLIILVTAIFGVFLISGCIQEKKYFASQHFEEFKQLNKCNVDDDCIVGQADVGTDLPSPSPECVTRAVINRFDDYFESKAVGAINIKCSCNLTSSSCITEYPTPKS